MADKALIERLRSQIGEIESDNASSWFEEEPRAREEGRLNAGRAERALPSAVDSGDTDSDSAFKKVLALVNASDKSERAIRERLVRSGFSEKAIEHAVLDAKRYGFIDDARFADVLIRSRISQFKGSAGIVRELAENGIDADDVAGWPHEYAVSHDEELDRALTLLRRKPPQSKNRREGAYRRLMQRGFTSSVASSAARLWSQTEA